MTSIRLGRPTLGVIQIHNSSSTEQMPTLEMDRMIEAMRGRTLRRGRRGNRYLTTNELGWKCSCGRHHKIYGHEGYKDQRATERNTCPLCLDTAPGRVPA